MVGFLTVLDTRTDGKSGWDIRYGYGDGRWIYSIREEKWILNRRLYILMWKYTRLQRIFFGYLPISGFRYTVSSLK